MTFTRRCCGIAAAAILIAAAPGALHAQTATISGMLSGFDVVNLTGQVAHGFEIQIDGIQASDLYYSMPGQQYGMPSVVTYATGIYLRYQASYNNAAGTWSGTTPMHTPGAPFGWQDCYQLGVNYKTSGCEHFGQTLRPLASGQTPVISGRWLVEDPNNPGTLISFNPPAAIPFATWSVAPVTVVSAPPVVVAEIEAPEPPPQPELFGDAQWIKIFTTQLPFALTADQLNSTDPTIVPVDPTQTEVAWDILQKSPPSNGNGKNNSSKTNSGKIKADTRAVVRRYELYKYTGAYDPLTHKAVCADGTCTAPSAGELGDPTGAQNSAANVVADSLTVVRSGSGTVAGGNISCGSSCAMFAPAGTVITLSENPGGWVFTGWNGPCSGAGASCAVTVQGPVTLGATFKNQFTLSVGTSNPGTVVGTPTGNDRALNCGGACSAKFTDGTQVTLTAVPPAGKTFVSWSGACSGTDPVCAVTVNANLSAKAAFSK